MLYIWDALTDIRALGRSVESEFARFPTGSTACATILRSRLYADSSSRCELVTKAFTIFTGRVKATSKKPPLGAPINTTALSVGNAGFEGCIAMQLLKMTPNQDI